MKKLNTTTPTYKPRPRATPKPRNFDTQDATTYALSRLVRHGILSCRILQQYTTALTKGDYASYLDRNLIADCRTLTKLLKLPT